MHLVFYRKQFYHVQKTLQTDFSAFPGSEWAAVKTLPGCEVPVASNTEKSTATKGDVPIFSCSDLGIHGRLRARNLFLTVRRWVIGKGLFKINTNLGKFNIF